MNLIEVNDKKTINSFYELPYSIYKNDDNWTPPLRMMIESLFDEQKNNSLKNGHACRWILFEKGRAIGRIAAFVVPNYASSFEQVTGGIGFFECIDEQDAADVLFDMAIAWLKTFGAEAVDGPVNIGENFFNWGLLVDGFMPQSFGMPYNKPYYRKLFENYGFLTYYEQYSYHLNITSPDLPERFWKIAARVANKSGYSYERFRFKQMDKYIADFINIYQQAWAKHDNYKKIDQEEIRTMLHESKLMIDEDFIWFVYHDDEPVAFFMMVPDLNLLFKHFKNGKLNIFSILKMIYLKRRKVINRCRVLVMGVTPHFQKSGIESAIFYRLRSVLLEKKWYNEMELGWVGDFNPKMISIFEAVGGQKAKTHITFRYLFDRRKEFKRAMPILD